MQKRTYSFAMPTLYLFQRFQRRITSIMIYAVAGTGRPCKSKSLEFTAEFKSIKAIKMHLK